MDEEVILFGLGILLVVVAGCLLNPDFWQGFRNSKFLDEVQNEQRLHADDDKRSSEGTGKEIQDVL